MAAPTYQGKGTKANGTGSSITPSYPASINANDLILLYVVSVGNGTITVPAGWVEILSGTILYPPAALVKLYRRSALGTESGTITVSRSGYSGSSTLMAQMYLYRGTAQITVESSAYPTYGGNLTTITWNAVTVGGSERTLAALVINYNGGDPGTPTGYTNSATDNDGSSTYMELHTWENVSSDGSVTTTTSSTSGWTTAHLSIYNAPPPAGGKRFFIVN